MFDNIVKLSVSDVRLKPEEFNEDVVLVDTKGVKDYIKICCRDIRGKEFLIAFDSTAYICNDNGKTIETLPVACR